MVYCYCSTLLLVIVVNRLLALIYTLNVIIGTYACLGENVLYMGLGAVGSFHIPQA